MFRKLYHTDFYARVIRMNKVDEQVEDILTRGVEEVIVADRLRARMKERLLRIKLGIDPTSPHIHLGRASQLMKLRAFQKAGHQIVFIVGDFTGTVGDTSDKDAERPMLSPETVRNNLVTYFEQAGKIIDMEKTELHYNSSWLSKLTFSDAVGLADYFSVSDFISRDMIKRRLEGGKRVSLREMLYPLMQGYDSVHVRADVEIGGVDQRFNLLAGRTLQEAHKQTPQEIMMLPLLLGTDGRKMSSSWGNTINITDVPDVMYGKVMSMRDETMISYYIALTELSLVEIETIKKGLIAGTVHPKDAKMKLAKTITEFFHGEDEAVRAEGNFTKAFTEGGIPDDCPIAHVPHDSVLADTLVEHGYVPSKAEYRRLLEQGAIKNMETGEVLSDPYLRNLHPFTLKIGKKIFVKIAPRN